MTASPSRPLVLIAGPLQATLMAALEAEFDTVRRWEGENGGERESAPWRRRAGEVRAIASSAWHGADAALMDALPELELIANFGVGYDRVDVAAARARGVAVTNTPHVLDACVADTALALILSVLRGICTADRFVRAGRWAQGAFPLATSLHGKVCGIVGLGAIGRAIATRAQAFGMQIAYCGRHQQEGVAHPYFASAEALAAASDVLVVAVPGGPDTRCLIGPEVLRALGPAGVLVNIARGSVVDEPALVRALQAGELGGAGLDVFESEPHVPEALLAMDNVVLTPHLASGTRETREAMGQLVLDNLRAHFAGRPLLTPVP